MKAIIRKDEQAVSPVIATILMVAITVVLAAVLYVMVSGLLTPVGGSKPIMSFVTPPTLITNGVEIRIASTQPASAPGNFKVNLKVNATFGAAVAFPTAGAGTASVAVSGYTGSFTVTWQDVGGDVLVSGGDRIQVTKSGGLPGSSTYTLILLWNNEEVGSVPWTTS